MSRVLRACGGLAWPAMVLLAAAPAQADTGGLDVSPRAVERGGRVTLSTLNPGLLALTDSGGGVAVTSPAFAGEVRLAPAGKTAWEAEATVRCDVDPGTYPVEFEAPVEFDGKPVEGRVRVRADRAGVPEGCPAPEAFGAPPVLALTGGAAGALTAAGLAAWVAMRRRSARH
ncbi:hypothetical protein [Streptomyces sp. NPDC097619]|uniref:hypothetical protein n=1 Tax=Streptomyces sp. NPDC097619 TaxID=3157228 RepID=UPI00331DAC93